MYWDFRVLTNAFYVSRTMAQTVQKRTYWDFRVLTNAFYVSWTMAQTVHLAIPNR